MRIARPILWEGQYLQMALAFVSLLSDCVLCLPDIIRKGHVHLFRASNDEEFHRTIGNELFFKRQIIGWETTPMHILSALFLEL